MPKCNDCYLCTGLPQEFSVPCKGICAGCGATEKEAGVFRRSDKEAYCADQNRCMDRVLAKP